MVTPDYKRAAPRFDSHALVEISMGGWNPFAKESAVLVDLSWGGFKIEFISQIRSPEKGAHLKMKLPLAPFGIFSPEHISLMLCVAWYDASTLRCGGTILKPSPTELHTLEKIIHFVKESGSKEK